MAYAPYTHLTATSDFGTFQFASPTLPEPTTRQVQFNGQQGGRIYQADFRNKPIDKKDDPAWPDTKDFLCVVLTTLQLIEIYTERYPRRILRFSGDTTLKALVFGTILTRYYHLLSPLFRIEAATSNPGCPSGCERSRTFVIRRKPVPFFSVHTIESTWNGVSRIFNSGFSIELDKSIRIGLTLPTM